MAGLFFLALQCQDLCAQDPLHRRYTVEDGLPSNKVYAILQDHEGYMWFATDAGASRFDGHSFTNLSVAEGLSDNYVVNLAEDSKGRIWFLTLNGRLCFWDKGRVFDKQAVPELGRFVAAAGWQSFAEDVHGRLWFAGVRNDVLRLDLEGDADSLWSWPWGNTSVVLDSVGEVFVVASREIRTQYAGGWKAGAMRSNLLQASSIIMPSGRVGDPPVVVEEDGIYATWGGSWSKILSAGFDDEHHERCWTDGVGDLWVRRKDHGLELWPRTPGGFAERRTLFGDELINAEFVDSEGDRWFSSARNGVIHCTATEFQSRIFNGKPALFGEAMQVVQKLRDGSVLIGSADGILYHADKGTPRPVSTPSNIGRIVDIAEEPGGLVWIVADNAVVVVDKGLTRSSEVPIRIWRHEEKHARAGAKAVEVAPDGKVWVNNFGLQEVGRANGFLLRDQLPREVVPWKRTLTSLADRKGRLWFEEVDRLLCFENGSLRQVSGLVGKTGLRITWIAEAGSDTLLIGTSGAGVLFVVGGQVVGELTIENGALSNDVVRVRSFGDTLLLVTNKGLQVVVGDPGRGVFALTELRLPSAGQINDALLDGQQLLLATSRGFCTVPIPQHGQLTAPPPIHLQSLHVNQREAGLAAMEDLEEHKDGLRLVFRAITLAQPEEVRYQFRLHDMGPWNESPDGIVELTSLAAGDYAVGVRARKVDSDWSEPYRLEFEVEARWWNKAWVRVWVWLVGSTLIILFTRLVVRHRYEKALAVNLQREALNEERRRIAADVHDDLGADLSRLMHHAHEAERVGNKNSGIAVGLAASIRKIDEIIWSLDPRKDTLVGTVHFVEHQARELVTSTGLHFRTSVHLLEEDLPLAASLRREVMLIAREAVRNAVQHANAGTVRIDWAQKGELVRLAIEDDGRGMDPREYPDRHGLQNMRVRASNIGGDLRIMGASPHGTRIELRFTVPHFHPNG